MDKKIGIDNLVIVFDKLACIFEDGVAYFKDGVQIWDLPFIPKAIGHIALIAKVLPNAIKESKDLEVDEIAELAGIVIARIMASLTRSKK